MILHKLFVFNESLFYWEKIKFWLVSQSGGLDLCAWQFYSEGVLPDLVAAAHRLEAAHCQLTRNQEKFAVKWISVSVKHS